MGGKKRSHSKSKNKKAKVSKEQPEIPPEELDRFAGSSDEEADAPKNRDDESDAADNDSDEEQPPPVEKSKPKKKVVPKQKHDDDEEGVAADREDSSHDDDHDEDGDDSSSEDDEDDFDAYEKQQQQKHGAAGMADAMAKILGTTTASASTPTPVLSKTITPLQRIHQKEKEEAKLLREKRRQKVDHPLPALHIPLSVATSLTVGDTNKSVAKELEQERVHRRVATRGVVALFNAVAQHQKKDKEEAAVSAIKSKSSAEVKKMTKHGFLDMIKTAAVSKKDGKKTKKDEDTAMPPDNKGDHDDKPEKKWMALQDDYMLNPKKNWDESSDESNSSGDEEMEQNDVKKDKHVPKTNKKRRMIAA